MMTEADLNMTEVRIRLPDAQAQELHDQIHSGRVGDLVVDDDVDVSLVPVADIDQQTMDPSDLTEFFETDDGEVELVTKKSFHNFAAHELQATEGLNPRSVKHIATNAYHTLMRNVGISYIQRGIPPKSNGKHVIPLGMKANAFEEIVEKLKDGSLDPVGLGKDSRAFVYRFAKAFSENRRIQNEAMGAKLVGMGATALSAQRHELAIRY